MSDSLRISFSRETLTKSCENVRSELNDIVCEYAKILVDVENNDYEIQQLEKQLVEKKRKRSVLTKSEDGLAIQFEKKKRSFERLERLTVPQEN